MTTAASTWFSRALTAFGVAIVAVSIFSQADSSPLWVLVLVGISLVGWACSTILRERMPYIALVITVLAAAVATIPTDGIGFVSIIVVVLTVVGTTERPVWHGVSIGLLAAVVVPLGLLFSSIGPIGLLAIESGLLVATLAGYSRRQARAAEDRERELHAQRDRGTALAERQAVARDIHDVLAHALGGLVLQLDAIDAQLEAGKVAEAAVRVQQARSLAADGLAEARRAVDALRDETRSDARAAASADVISAGLRDLLDAHHALGGVVTLLQTGTPHALPAEQADALRRALQESLTNTRKHAPGAVVNVALRWAEGVELTVENAVPADRRAEGRGDGHGLAGMRERFAGFGSATAVESDGRFVVTVKIDA